MAEYIDRDKLIRHLEDDFEACGEPDSSIRPIAYGTILGLRGALSYARTLPTADVAEVRHGTDVGDMSESEEWYREVHICGECGCNWMTLYIEDAQICPRCGAKMDGRSDT